MKNSFEKLLNAVYSNDDILLENYYDYVQDTSPLADIDVDDQEIANLRTNLITSIFDCYNYYKKYTEQLLKADPELVKKMNFLNSLAIYIK